jgi:hypothetical protein
MTEQINVKAEDFIGLGKYSAQNLAEAKNIIFRLIRIDDKSFYDYPEDKRNDRICVEIDSGKITVAVLN